MWQISLSEIICHVHLISCFSSVPLTEIDNLPEKGPSVSNSLLHPLCLEESMAPTFALFERENPLITLCVPEQWYSGCSMSNPRSQGFPLTYTGMTSFKIINFLILNFQL